MTHAADLEQTRREALARHRAGELEAAETLYRALLADNARDGETWHLLSVLHGQRDHHREALDAARRAWNCGVRRAAVQTNIAQASRALGRLEDAAAATARAVALEPEREDNHLLHAEVLRALGRDRDALSSLQAGAADLSGSIALLTELGILALTLNDSELAESAFRDAVSIAPDRAQLWVNLGTAAQMTGRLAEAEEAYRKALSLAPDMAEAYWYLVQLRRLPVDGPDMAMIRHQLGRRIGHARAPLEFAAAKIHDDAGQVAEAMSHLERGNALVRSQFSYSVDADRERMQRLASLAIPGSGYRAPPGERSVTPIFILGMPRSGSTLLEQSLANHSRIAAGGEIPALQRLVRGALKEEALAFPEGLAKLSGRAISRIRERYLLALSQRARGCAFVTDKLPANFLYLPLIVKAFPQARLLHPVRTPLDTCFSCYQRLFSSPQLFAYSQRELGIYYRSYRELMEEGARQWPERLLDIRYEEMVADMRGRLRTALAVLGLEWEDDCASPPAAAQPIMTASAVQLRRPISAASIGKAAPYRAYLGELEAALGPYAGEQPPTLQKR